MTIIDFLNEHFVGVSVLTLLLVVIVANTLAEIVRYLKGR